ncbi:MAG: DUF2279 domain-containing protein [Candidatus Electrothrix sp. AX5]|jgi:uncharacterized protein YfiM (DUF2279 family)|uniref:Putative lipoprotein (DUF2279) n=1 Tax=Candidatus Electrothrix aarhusensis TaxID=1859131 RepID=A0A3S4T4Z5_9BACT|nr:DUF2279 domain-containing protein [Candidatus Electrothrix sp. AX5]RWX43164.1 putative lipoprotein (DUF2279) [Candidatus Electrothrix aarhusensis]
MKKYLFNILIIFFAVTEALTSPAFSGNLQNTPQNAPQDITHPDQAGKGTHDDREGGWWDELPKEKKALYTNISAAAFITLYGFADWDYGSGGFHFADEGWFEKDSKYGGADKAGHFWSTYAVADAFTGLYKHWGYDRKTAGRYGVFSSWAVQTIMELDDGTSETQGFDWGDMTMNTLGALTSMFMEQYPELDRKIDFRVEYALNVPVQGIFDDYSNMYYAVVVKLDGFDHLQHSWLQWAELHAGYCTQGYDTAEPEKERHVYFGISFNFSRFLYQHNYHKTGKMLEYLQVPYTVPKIFGKSG